MEGQYGLDEAAVLSHSLPRARHWKRCGDYTMQSAGTSLPAQVESDIVGWQVSRWRRIARIGVFVNEESHIKQIRAEGMQLLKMPVMFRDIRFVPRWRLACRHEGLRCLFVYRPDQIVEGVELLIPLMSSIPI